MARKPTDVFTDASTSRGHHGIGIYVPSLDLRLAEGVLKPPDTKAVNAVNYAELSAVRRALEILQRPVVIHTDSQWVAGACCGGWRVQAYPSLKSLASDVRFLLHKTGSTIEWVSREQNPVADKLARFASGYRKTDPGLQL